MARDRIYSRPGRRPGTHDIIVVQDDVTTVLRDLNDDEVFALREECNWLIYSEPETQASRRTSG